MTGADIIAEARAWLGTPWIHQQARKHAGCDCIGLVSGVAEVLGVPEAKAWRADPRFRGYGELPLPEKLLEACDIYLDRIDIPTARMGDIFVFSLMKQPMHFGLLSAVWPRYMIHGWRPARRVVENAVDSVWERRLVRAYRYKAH